MNKGGKFHAPALPCEERELFQAELDGVVPLTPHGRVLPSPVRLPPVPLSLFHDERTLIHESLHDPARWDGEVEDTSYVRPGISRQTLRRMRRGDWVAQAELDLHGLTRAEAKRELADFLYECKRRGARCVRIIHGKGLGSKDREPVLKLHVRHWLTQREEVLAFTQARPADGGSGAVVVLLKSASA
ncbi:MAG: Smr/MutS family protein [Pseudomonadota bacterium]|nr:Smr/MutS family protein [Pseudomonadota bacterium]MDP1905389.1 Smr/MutS family protein [Pseudomonadota bacterium]MDP2354155.1 Smr/MutS family protein [Pseudomonadota bacterium]